VIKRVSITLRKHPIFRQRHDTGLEDIIMRTFLLAVAALIASMTLLPGKATAAPFCSYIGSATGSFQSCGYHTWEQCLASVRGAGGFCMVNPADAWQRQSPRGRPYP
jgi:hypothetical protein